MENLKSIFPKIKEVLSDWNLIVNKSKTEFARLYLADKSELTRSGKSVRKEKLEDWRSNKSLGSLLCSEKDIERRRQLGNVAFANYQKCWLKGAKIPLSTKIKLYDALVVSVMLYNSNSWSAPTNVIEKLDITHRRHLRVILNVYWPHGRMSNKELYSRCETEKLSDRVVRFRWTMYGHVLRSDIKTPAFLSLKFAINNTYKSRKGRHQSNLFDILKSDLKVRDIRLESETDLFDLREHALNRKSWWKSFVLLP